MSKTPSTLINLDINETRAVKGLKNVVGHFYNSSTKINQSLELASKGWSVLSRLVSGAARTIGEFIKVSEVQIAAEERLAVALRRQGEFSESTVEELKAYASELQAATVIGDEATLGLMTQLSAMGVQESQLKEATKATIGLAEVTGSLDSAARLVGRAMQGDVAGLKRYGITATDAADATDKLVSLFALAEQKANTLTGRSTQLDNAWGDLKETIGASASNSDTLKESLAALTDTVTSFTTLLKGDAGIQVIDQTMRSMAGFASATINAGLGLSGLMNEWKLMTNGFIAEPIGPDLKEPWVQLADQLARVASGASEAKEALDEAAGVDSGGKDKGDDKPKDKPKKVALAPKLSFSLHEMDQLFAVEELGVLTSKIKEGLAGPIDGAIGSMTARLAKGRVKVSKGFTKFFQGIRAELAPEMAALANGMASSIASGMTGMVEALAKGGNVLKSIGGFFGGIIVQLGKMLIQLGTAGVLAGTLGTIIPAFAALTGGALGVAGGAATIAAGGAMVALGGAMGGGGGGSSAGAPSLPSARSGGDYEPAGGGSVRVSLPSRDDLFGGGTATAPITNNYYFNGPVGNARKLGADIADLSDAGRGLDFGRRRIR